MGLRDAPPCRAGPRSATRKRIGPTDGEFSRQIGSWNWLFPTHRAIVALRQKTGGLSTRHHASMYDAHWNPCAVPLAQGRPADIASYRRSFGTPFASMAKQASSRFDRAWSIRSRVRPRVGAFTDRGRSTPGDMFARQRQGGPPPPSSPAVRGLQAPRHGAPGSRLDLHHASATSVWNCQSDHVVADGQSFRRRRDEGRGRRHTDWTIQSRVISARHTFREARTAGLPGTNRRGKRRNHR